PAALIPILSPAVGEHYAVVDTLAHGLCLFTAGAVFFGLAMLLSTLFGDLWRPLLLTLLAAILLALPELAMSLRRPRLPALFSVMSGEAFFRTGRLPLAGLSASAVVAAALLYGAARNLARRDF